VSGDAPDPVDPADGARSPDDEGARPDKARVRPSGRTEVELEVSRQRSAGWTIFDIVLGALLVWKLGTVGVWVGVALLALGAYHAWHLLQTLLHKPGTIVISDREVSLPRGLCVPRPVVAKRADVTAVYFLRRSVPWNRAAPVLVVELGPKAMVFPRDWFASEADQRHVIHALLRDKPGQAGSSAGGASGATSGGASASSGAPGSGAPPGGGSVSSETPGS
jgi:hypothetical protein